MLDYVAKRILQEEPRQYLTLGSTAVPSFGDFTKSNIATLSINPSSKEFVSGKNILPTGKKRLVDKESLGLENSEKLKAEHADSVWNGCVSYFQTGNSYEWFNDLQLVLDSIGASYKSGTACHIDLVQWATSPAWKELPSTFKSEFIEKDREFFHRQTDSKNLELLIINGRQVFEVASRLPDFEFKFVEPLTYKYKGKTTNNFRFVGSGPNGKRILGWTGTLRNMRTSMNVREDHCREIGNWVKESI